MHLLAGFALALVTLAFVQSRPALPQLDEVPVARANINDLVASANQLGLNNLAAINAAFPQYAGLVQQITGIAHQVINALSPAQLFTLEQQALQTAQNVLSGNVPLETAVEQLFAQVQQALGQDSSILSNVQPVVQQLVSVAGQLLSNLPSNLGQRSAPVARANINDLVALGNQFGLNSLDGVLAAFPQYAGLVQQLTGIAHQVSNALTPGQLFTLEQQALQAAQNVLSGNVPLQTAVNQLFAQVQQALGSDSPILSNIQPVVQQLLAAVGPLLSLLPSNLGQRSAPVARANINDLVALGNQFGLNSLDGVLAVFPQYAGLVQQLTGIANQVANALSPAQLFTLEQQAIQAAQNVLSGNVPLETAVEQLFAQVQQALGQDSSILSNVQPVVQQLLGAVGPLLSLLPSNFGQRSAPALSANINDLLALVNQGLVQQFSGIAHQVINALTPSQLETLEQQILQAAQNVLSGGAPLQDTVDQLFAQVQEALGQDSSILDNVRPVVQQLVSVVGPLLFLLPSNLVG